MRSSLLPTLALCLAICACTSIPNIYAPPVQRKPFEIHDTGPVRHFLAMNDPAAAAHLVADVSQTLEAGSWRWTGQRPTFRFRLPAGKKLRFVMDFTIAEMTFQKTGPVTITFLVNGRQLDRVRYDSHGEKHFEKPVDPDWIRGGEENRATAELDKIWVAPDDGAKLGLILTRVGFLD